MSRRTLGGLAAVGLGLPVLAACGGDGGSDEAVDPGAGAGPPEPAAPSSSAPSTSGPLATTDEVPVGGATILADAGVVVTQPVAGEFTAFSALCTHQGCPVNEVTDGEVVCPCHLSAFSIETGEPTRGPAVRALAPVEISVTGDTISLA